MVKSFTSISALKLEKKDVHLYITNMFKFTQHILPSLDCHALLDCLVAALDCLLPALLHPELPFPPDQLSQSQSILSEL
ncbi:hypothetical protein Tco_0756904 [Tanacetum coccineum]